MELPWHLLGDVHNHSKTGLGGFQRLSKSFLLKQGEGVPEDSGSLPCIAVLWAKSLPAKSLPAP